MFSDGTQQFDFYAFSQSPEGQVSDLYANSTVMGVANILQIDNQYRHYLISPNQTIELTLTGIFGKGYPSLMVKVAGKPTTISSQNSLSYDFRKDLDSATQSVNMTLDPATLMRVDPTCERAGYANGTAGN